MSENKNDKIPSGIIKARKAWSRDAFLLRVAYAGLTISAIVFSIIVAAEIAIVAPIYITIFAIISAISTGLLSAFDIPSKSNRVRDAWRLLNEAIMRYKTEEIDVKALIDAYHDGEKMVGGVPEKYKI